MKRTVQELESLDQQCCRLLEGGDKEGRSLVPQETADYVSKMQPMVKELQELWSLEEYLAWVLRVQRLRCACAYVEERPCVCVPVCVCVRVTSRVYESSVRLWWYDVFLNYFFSVI